jgi:hypothetical protein
LNNPSRYTDPSGHKVCDGAKEDGGDCVEWNANHALSRYGIKIVGAKEEDKWKVYDAAYLTARKLVPYFGGSSIDAFKKTFGDILIKVGKGRGPRDENGNLEGNCATTGGSISCENAMSIGNAVHEFFHVFDNNYSALSTSDETCDPDHGGCLASNYYPYEWVDDKNYQTAGYKCAKVECVAHPPSYSGYGSAEAFANLGQNWVLEATNVDLTHTGFAPNQYGDNLRGWMGGWMSTFLKNMGLR